MARILEIKNNSVLRDYGTNEEMLCLAIIRMACEDYVRALKTADDRVIKDCERFFLDGEVNFYTNIDGEVFIEKCRKAVGEII